MFDLKVLNSALEQLEAERGIPKEKIVAAIADALAAAYKRDYGKRGQIIRATFDPGTGKTEFSQIKVVVDENMVRMDEEGTEGEGAEREGMAEKQVFKEEAARAETDAEEEKTAAEGEDQRIRFNPEHHILLEDAKKIKKGAVVGEELVFPLESKDDYGRIAAQTAKQVIIQRIREAERVSVMGEYEKRKGEIVSGTVQRVERGAIYVDLGRVTGALQRNEQVPGEYYRQGERIKAYLYDVEETPRDITLRLSRTHPQLLQKLFEIEAPEVASGVVEIKNIAREPGMRSKIAVTSHDEHIDPVGSCVGQRGVRVSTVTNELGGEKIDIVEWSPDERQFIERSLSPAQVESVTLNEETRSAVIRVRPDQYSLAIGRGGQNARLAAKLTGWKIDIREVEREGGTPEEESAAQTTGEEGIAEETGKTGEQKAQGAPSEEATQSPEETTQEEGGMKETSDNAEIEKKSRKKTAKKPRKKKAEKEA